MQSKREILGEQLYEFFEKIGIEPILGLVIFITIALLYRGYYIFFVMEADEYNTRNKINDLFLILIALLIYHMYLF